MNIRQSTITSLKEFINKNGSIELPALGTSMYPLIKKQDVCRFSYADSTNIQKGDIILYHSNTGGLVAHRFIKFTTNSEDIKFFFKGDTNLGMDDPIISEQIVGKLTSIKKGNFILNDTNLITIFWKKTILLFPILSAMLRSSLNKRGRK